MTVLGMLIMAQSIFWEYVRVKPTYRFITEPWSLRGYETTQGLVIAASALAIIVLVVAIARGIVKETLVSSSIAVGAVVVFATVTAILANAPDIEMPFPIHVIVSMIGAVVGVALLERFIPKAWIQRRRLARFGIWTASVVVLLFGVIGPLLSNEQPFWVFVAVASAVMGGLVLFRPPMELAGVRISINAILAIWVMSMTMSATLRQTLQAAQFDKTGLSAQVQDLQITSGVLLAWFGGLLGFAGAVGLWAKRRDQIIAHERARKQQEAAAESQEQLTA
jgi:hypothetical protein